MAPQMSVWGIDMAKLVCHVVGMDGAGAVVVWKRLARSEWLAFTQTLRSSSEPLQAWEDLGPSIETELPLKFVDAEVPTIALPFQHTKGN
jgi:hypothetical protein